MQAHILNADQGCHYRAQPPVKPRQGLSNPRKWQRRCVGVNWGCWNVRTLYSSIQVGADGTLHVEGAAPDTPESFCSILSQAEVSLCCISEHRWRGEGIVQLEDHTIVYSGVPLTAAKAEQGVGIVLDKEMCKAWRAAGEFCDFQGSRLMRIQLLLNKHKVNVISVYAPTYNSDVRIKDQFYRDLRAMLQTIPSSEEVFILGDFNARVGRNPLDDKHDAVALSEDIILGPFGLGHTNDNGERLLALCESAPVGQLRVMDTFFKHKHYGTWFHNSSRRWYHIDHVLAARRSAQYVMDVATKPGIHFDTDHRLVKVKLRFPPLVYKGFRGPGKPAVMSSRVKLPPLNTANAMQPDTSQQFNTLMTDLLAKDLLDDCSNWGHALRRVGEKFLGIRCQTGRPVWKQECHPQLEAISNTKKAAFQRSKET